MQKKTVITADYNEIEDIIYGYFGVRYESVAMNEWNNYSSYEITVTPKEISEKEVQELLKEHYEIDGILDYLCYKGILEAGEYVIKVFW